MTAGVLCSCIEDFVRRHGGRSNRFVITSRIAGYRNAPLDAPFAHYTVQEMDEIQIRRFLERWCTAVEEAQTPELSAQVRQPVAQREIDSIMEAVQNTPGVRRLAANPLMLRTLALIHRAGAQLPHQRIELYKLAADTLGRTWRPAQGVPESALVEERYLTRLLSTLSYWLHVHKPTGIATEQEVYNILGEEWARINRLSWDANDPDPAILHEVDGFLSKVREHTGLFVERAPKRYGFMHLTFEEYYAARHLVARPRQAAQRIRQHLHDPRWDEPILLALGFMGLEFPEETEKLLETAILAEGEEAEDLQFTPSRYEEILGRDYLFALRCLGDNIPADPQLVQRLITRLADEVHRTGAAQYQRYRKLLETRLAHLVGSNAAPTLSSALLTALRDEDATVRYRAATSLVQLGQASPEVVAGLIDVLQNADSWIFRRDSAHLLGQMSLVTDSVIFALWRGLLDSDNRVRTSCAQSLALLGRRFPDMAETIAAKLVQAIQEQEFDKPDTVEFSRRTGHDYAFDGLWLLVEGGSL